MNIKSPLISVIIATYNRRSTVGRAIDSVFAQTYPPSEIIVVDDGSADGSAEWIGQAYPGVRLIALPRNKGAAGARNAALRDVCGDVVAFLDSDDWWENDYLRDSVQVLWQRPEAVMVVSDVYMLLTYDNPPSTYVHNCRPNPDFQSLQENLLLQNFITTMSCVMVRRDVIEAVGLLNETLEVVHDKEWYIRLTAHGGVVCTNRPLVWRTIANDNLVADIARFLQDQERFWSSFFSSSIGGAFKQLFWLCRAKTYETIASMFWGRGKRWKSVGLNFKAFIFTCFDFHPKWRLLAIGGRGIYGALRKDIGDLWRQFQRRMNEQE